MRTPLILRSLVPLAILAVSPPAGAEPQQVGDLRIGANVFPSSSHYFDPGFSGLMTRGVDGAPVQVPAVFSGTSQKANTPGPGDPTRDLIIVTSENYTDFKNVNRFVCDPDGPDGEEPGAQAIGALQYEIDLAAVEAYLADSGETLSTLELRLSTGLSDPAKEYDIYLSYTEAGEGIAETSISADDAGANYSDFWLLSRPGGVAEPVGTVINGTHKILNIDQLGAIDKTTDLTALYNAGVRKVNLIVMVGSFYSGRTLFFNDVSGIHIETSGLASQQVAELRLPAETYPDGWVADQFGPLATRTIPGAAIELPIVFLATSQNQGGNPDPVVPAARFSLDGPAAAGGTNVNTFKDQTATVTGWGPNGIGASTADEFEYTAWRKSGDFEVTVELTSLTSVEAGARAGLMVRGSLDADAAHVFLGVQQGGEPVVVTRDAAGGTATETLDAAGAFPRWLRITRAGDEFSFATSEDGTTYNPAVTPTATVVLTDPVYVGMAATSGSAENNAVAVFAGLSERLADTATDIALQTWSSTTVIRQLNRYASDVDCGMVQWAIDLTPLDGYLTGGRTLDSLSLRLLAEMSDLGNGDGKKAFDVYLSYTDPEEPITLTGISEVGPISNYNTFFAPAIDAFPGDVVNETHKVLVAEEEGNMDLTEDLMPLYTAGVRTVNLMIASNKFYSNRTVTIQDGSGLFIETSGGSSAPVLVTDVSRTGDVLSVTVDGLTSGSTYHLGGSATLTGITSIPGTDITATGGGDVLTATIGDAAYFVQVLEGAAP